MLVFTLVSLIATTALPSFAFPGYVLSPKGVPMKRETRAPIGRRAAEPYSPQFPYTNASLDGQAGSQVGGVRVPAPGDTAHYFQDPPPGAQRGPCPGLNTLANHGFISRDGITTYTELVAALQNAYNLQYDAAVFLTLLGISFDGDPITEMLSIGNDATSQTNKPGAFIGDEGGLSRHGTFELDASLTRNDYYLHGDSGSFNATLFGMMAETAASTSSAEDPLFDFNALALFRYQRYQQSVAENPNFYFSTTTLHNYAAAAFLYTVFPGNNGRPDLPTISSFFGAVKNSDGSYSSVPERFPPNYTNTIVPTNVDDIGAEATKMYAVYPVPFGGNDGFGSWINASSVNVTGPTLSAGSSSSNSSASGFCAVYSLILEIAETNPNPYAMLSFCTEKLNPVALSLGCTLYTLPE